ncbi:hypothetical protein METBISCDRAFT_15558 [Metschnikowia bicuspidata]|uniref:COX assembly mitochondrial protein n=1 Tax=Metschnikowia bicuspidata TaxID=27322 RepID=A0A4P9ZDD7_9ASCO|nr:hypothetical protein METBISCDRAFT_15558 [Metschnikowia bicuspidata]
MSLRYRPYDGAELPTHPSLPVWVLTPKEEQVIFERWRKKAFQRCDDLIRAYIDCSNLYNNPLEGIKKCKEANERSLGCVAKYQTMKYLDEEREIMIADKKLKRKIYLERLTAAQVEKQSE